MDHAAATPIDAAVQTAMHPYFSDNFYNPSATYNSAVQVHKDLEAARVRVAHWFGARPSEIIFTAGGTEANNLAIHGVMAKYREGNMVVSGIEHDSVLAPASRYGHRLLPVTDKGVVDITKLNVLINNATVLVSIMYANNEVGSIQPIREVAKVIDTIRAERRKSGNNLPIYLHTDACQAANYLDLHASRLGADLISINGGKIYGPKQSGALYIKAGTMLEPLVYGGGQERGLRSGTENVAGAIGLATALDIVQSGRHEEVKRLQTLQQQFIAMLQKAIPNAVVNGSLKHRLPNNVHVTLPGQDNERLLFALDEAGILAAAGSACSASDEEPSHVLKAMGISEADAQASLRFTMGKETTAQQVKKTAATLSSLVS